MSTALPFRFDRGAHTYIALDTGAALPHITGMLERTGWIDDLWFTEESSDRGTAVHELTKDYDLEALDPDQCVSVFRPYLLAYVKARSMMVPPAQILGIEEPFVHPYWRYGGRPDRHGVFYGLRAVLELKSGEPDRAHQIQTALQANLLAPTAGLPATAIARFCLYLRGNGKFKLEEHTDRRDYDEAARVIRTCCQR